MYTMHMNLHTHTQRCGHAEGSDRAYVESAIRAGYDVIGFADHVPIPFPEGYVSGCRMYFHETKEYVESLLSLREEYKDDIRILIGYEAEFMPFLFRPMMQNLARQKAFDYLILGQHFIRNEFDGRGATWGSDDPVTLHNYTSTLITGMETGVYTYVAHPDMFCYSGDPADFQAEARRICEASLRLNLPLEINFTGLEEGRHYPREDFWAVAGEMGASVVFGSDAHSPSCVYRPRAIEMANALAEKYRLKVMETIPVIDPKPAFDALMKRQYIV